MKGDTKSNFSADDLAKKIEAAPSEELVPLYQQAMLKPTIFKKLFDTFHGDTVSKAKLKQRAADLNVHPEETANCVELYIAGMTAAKLVTVEGDLVTHVASRGAAVAVDQSPTDEAQSGTEEKEPNAEESTEIENHDSEQSDVPPSGSGNGEQFTKAVAQGPDSSGPRAVFNVTVTLDSSLDIEKLQKQLELLKRFGAI